MKSLSLKRRFLAQKLFVLTKKRYNLGCDIPAISFEDLSVAFQSPLAMDLRNVGLCSLSCDYNNEPGLLLAREYVDFTPNQFFNLLNDLKL